MRTFYRIRQTSLSLIICALLAGCASGPTDDANWGRPAPVQESGMTFDWGKDVKAQALQMIESSRHICYLDMYELSDPDIMNALIAAKRRGVDVRVVLDATEKHSTRVGQPTLLKAGLPVRMLSIKQGISHVKMLIADGKVLIGGMNYCSDSWNNNDASVYIAAAPDSYRNLFLWDFTRAAGTPAAAPVTQLPLVYDRGIEPQVVAAVQSARKSVSMEAFDLTSAPVITGLLAAMKRGVVVEVLLDPGQSYNRRAATTLRDAGAIVRYYRPYQAELMHAKILDVDKGKTFLIGSANFSHQAYTYNHEADIVLHNVPNFDQSLQADLSVQVGRGTDYPEHGKRYAHAKSWSTNE